MAIDLVQSSRMADDDPLKARDAWGRPVAHNYMPAVPIGYRRDEYGRDVPVPERDGAPLWSRWPRPDTRVGPLELSDAEAREWYRARARRVSSERTRPLAGKRSVAPIEPEHAEPALIVEPAGRGFRVLGRDRTRLRALQYEASLPFCRVTGGSAAPRHPLMRVRIAGTPTTMVVPLECVRVSN